MITLVVNDDKELDFEHSLVSLSKWEARYEKAFFNPNSDEKLTEAEWNQYFEYMYVGPRKRRHLVLLLTVEDKIALINYINRSNTATTIKKIQQNRGGPRENPTSELMYYWLVAFRIPFKPTDEWHLNRLTTLVEVCSAKQAPAPKDKASKRQLAQSMRAENERRLREMGTKG